MMANAYPDIPAVSDRKVAKAFVKYDHYLEDPSREIFKDDSKPLREFLKMRAMVATAPCETGRAGRLLLPGDEILFRKRVSTEFGRKYTRSLLKVLWENDQNDECLSDFNEENLFASRSGRVRFHGVIRMKRNGVQAKKNYDSAHNILTRLYSKNGDIPEDILHLLNLIKNYPSKSGLYHIHASLVPLSKRQASYFKMFEQLMYNMDEHSRGEILQRLPYGENWKKMIEHNRLLQRIYDFKPKIYQVPESPQQQNQPTFEEQLARSKKRKRDENSNMSTYLRHRTAHRMDDVGKEREMGQLDGGYQAEDSELVALVRLPLVHPRLQEELYDAGELEDLKFDELF